MGTLTMGSGSIAELEIGFAGDALAWDSVAASAVSLVEGAIIRLLVAPGVDLLQLTLLTWRRRSAHP